MNRQNYSIARQAAQQNGGPLTTHSQPQGGCAVPSGGPMPVNVISNTGARNLGWSPPDGACAKDAERLLCWMIKGSCTFNKFGTPTSVKLRTNTLVLPDATTGFAIGPGANQQSLGVFFPRTWAGESVYHGIARLKVAFSVNITAGALTPDDVTRGLFDDLDFRILQVGSVDSFNVVIQLEAQDAERSTDYPNMGGYFFPDHSQFVPFALAPELFTFDFQGIAPGAVGTDAYTVQAGIRCYWDLVC